MADERLYVVAYDISDQKRWRRVFRIMKGHGTWLQLSLFQCRLSARRRVELGARLAAVIHHGEDQVLILDLGPADTARVSVASLGKAYDAPTRQAIVI